jgi:hypothetical protein
MQIISAPRNGLPASHQRNDRKQLNSAFILRFVNMHKKLLVLVITAAVLAFSCKDKKKVSLSGDDTVQITDLIDAFPPLKLPYLLQDSSISKKSTDSNWISYHVLTQFIPDSVFPSVFGKEKKIRTYPLGRISNNNQNYLLAKSVAGNHSAAYVFCFDNRDKFIAGMPILVPDANPATIQYFTIDPKLTMTKLISRKNSNGTINEGKDVFVLNTAAKNFMLIMTVGLDPKSIELTNPIDTLPAKSKFAGDYLQDANNLVSIRDDKRPNHVRFFVHLEKNDGQCTAELKGEATMAGASQAVYHALGDACNLQFQFTSSTVTLTEQNCGAHRGVDCLFEGRYLKKKVVKKTKTRK